VRVAITNARTRTSGSVALQAPDGWSVQPATRPFTLSTASDSAIATFTITAPARAASAAITATATVGDARYSTQRIEVKYDHLPLQVLQPPARIKAVSFDLAIRGRNVGYIAGAGDRVAEGLRQMGYTITDLGTDLGTNDLTAEKLRTLDAVVIGIRAFNVRDDLERALPALFAYAEAGGTVISQYNTTADLATNLAPYPITVSQDRVTEEDAPVTFLAPEHPVLNTPNRITARDFDGWVQERGLYFPNRWDPRFTPILAFNDTGEAPVNGSLLVALHGRGHWVYTGLSFFRQLPAGVPGAYRLFANLVSLGKR
jgi:hypothetical protein